MHPVQPRDRLRVPWLLAIACILAFSVLGGPYGATRVAAAPILTVSPDRGYCNTPIAVRGAGLPPGLALAIRIERLSDGFVRERAASATVAADGTFDATFALLDRYDGLCITTLPDGLQYRISAVADGTDGGRAPLASVVYTLIASRFTLTPDRGPCGVPVVARGEQFPPGSRVIIRGPFSSTARSLRDASMGPEPETTVADDGTFTLSLVPCGTARPLDDGIRLTLAATVLTSPGSPDVGAGRPAYFTVAAAPPPGLPNTGGGSEAVGNASPITVLIVGGFLIFLGILARGRGRVSRGA